MSIEYSPSRYPVNFNILLDQVNRIRMALAIGQGTLEALPYGKLGSAHQCVLARALSNGWKAVVDGDTIEFRYPYSKRIDFQAATDALCNSGFKARRTLSGIEMDATRTMRNFVVRFDEGQFPNLILED